MNWDLSSPRPDTTHARKIYYSRQIEIWHKSSLRSPPPCHCSRAGRKYSQQCLYFQPANWFGVKWRFWVLAIVQNIGLYRREKNYARYIRGYIIGFGAPSASASRRVQISPDPADVVASSRQLESVIPLRCRPRFGPQSRQHESVKRRIWPN